MTLPWDRHWRKARLNWAMASAVEHPQSPFPRVNLGRALLEAGQFQAGLAELEQARSLMDKESQPLVEEMIAEVEQEVLRSCPHCQTLNTRRSLACRTCLRSLSRGLLLTAIVACSRPMLRLLRRGA